MEDETVNQFMCRTIQFAAETIEEVQEHIRYKLDEALSALADAEQEAASAPSEVPPILSKHNAHHLRHLIQFVSQELLGARTARIDDLPVKSASHIDKAITVLSLHAGPWCVEAAKLSPHTLLYQACRENEDLRKENARLNKIITDAFSAEPPGLNQERS